MKLSRLRTYDKHWLSNEHLRNELKSNAVKGSANTVAGQIISFVISLASTIFLARMLKPESFGLVAMVTSITAFITLFTDFGLSTAVIQQPRLTHRQASSAFWMNVVVGTVFALLVFAAAPLLVKFYHEPRLLAIVFAFGASIFFIGFSVQYNALFKRQMKFKVLAVIKIVSTCAGIIIGVGMVVAGAGYWGLVALSVLTPVFSAILLWASCSWRPSMVFDRKAAMSMLRFGSGITAFDVVNYFTRNMDNILIGRFIGAAALGLYSKAYQLLMLPITQLRNPLNLVALPALSTLQHEPQRYATLYRRYVGALAFFSMPLVVYLFVYSEKIILIILGSQWVQASYIFKLLAITAFIQPVVGTQGLVLITTGRAKRYFMFGVITAVVTVTGFVIGIQWGMEGIAISQAVVMYTLLIPMLHYCFKDTAVTVGMFFREIRVPALYSLLMGVCLHLLEGYVDGFGLYPVIQAGMGFLIGCAVYILLWISFPHSRKFLNELLDLRKFILKKPQKPLFHTTKEKQKKAAHG